MLDVFWIVVDLRVGFVIRSMSDLRVGFVLDCWVICE